MTSWPKSDPLSPARLVPKLPRDLCTICLKCLEKKPASRYASALALADDLRRYLDGNSIVARPAGTFENGFTGFFFFGAREFATVRSSPDKIGIAELANRSRPVFFSPRPEVAAGKAAEHRGASCLSALALERVKNLLDRVCHLLALCAVA